MHCVITNERVHSEWVIPPHVPYNWNKVNRIARSMKRSGWKGQPLLIVRSASWKVSWGRGWYRALTGSHRLVAASKADIKISAKVITIHGRFPWKQMMVWDDYYDISKWLARHTNKVVVNIFEKDLNI